MSQSLHLFVFALILPYLWTIVSMVRRRKLRAKYSFLWLAVGFMIVLFTVIPGLMTAAAHAVGILYPPALLFVVAIALLLVVSVHFSWELSRMEERTRVLAEEVALLSARSSIDVGRPAPGRHTVVATHVVGHVVGGIGSGRTATTSTDGTP